MVITRYAIPMRPASPLQEYDTAGLQRESGI